MKISVSACVLAIAMLLTVPGTATAQCQAQKNAVKNTERADKEADKAVSKQQRTANTLARTVQTNTRRVESLIAKQEKAVIKIREKTQKDIDRAENQRIAVLAKAAELTAQAAQCALSGGINSLLGTTAECPASTRNALLAAAQRAASQAAQILIKVESVRDRGSRQVASKQKEHEPKIKAEQQKLERSKTALALALARLPALEQAAAATQTRLDAANAALTLCLGR